MLEVLESRLRLVLCSMFESFDRTILVQVSFDVGYQITFAAIIYSWDALLA